jgi:hypothetical protein
MQNADLDRAILGGCSPCTGNQRRNGKAGKFRYVFH